jgi:hypothetical protein
LPARESLTETTTPGDRIENWDTRSLAVEPHRPGAALGRMRPVDRKPNARERARRDETGRERAATLSSSAVDAETFAIVAPNVLGLGRLDRLPVSCRSPDIALRRWVLPPAERPVDWGLSNR